MPKVDITRSPHSSLHGQACGCRPNVPFGLLPAWPCPTHTSITAHSNNISNSPTQASTPCMARPRAAALTHPLRCYQPAMPHSPPPLTRHTLAVPPSKCTTQVASAPAWLGLGPQTRHTRRAVTSLPCPTHPTPHTHNCFASRANRPHHPASLGLGL